MQEGQNVNITDFQVISIADKGLLPTWTSFYFVDSHSNSTTEFTITNLDSTMKELVKVAAEIGKAAVLDGTVNSNDLRHNKKQLAVKLAKTAIWTLVQRHPLFVAIKYGLFVAICIFLAFLATAIYLWS